MTSYQLTARVKTLRNRDTVQLRRDDIFVQLDRLAADIKAGVQSGQYPQHLNGRIQFFVGHSFAAAIALAGLLWNLQEQQERDDIIVYHHNDIETPKMKAIFEISAIARLAIEREHRSKFGSMKNQLTIFCDPSSAESYNQFMHQLQAGYDAQLHARAASEIKNIVRFAHSSRRVRVLQRA